MSGAGEKNGAVQPKGPRTYKLKVPITFGQEKVSELTIRRPRGKDIRDLPADTSKSTLGQWLDVAAALSEQPPPLIDELDAADALEVVGIVAGFVAPSPETGATSSVTSRTASAGAPASS